MNAVVSFLNNKKISDTRSYDCSHNDKKYESAKIVALNNVRSIFDDPELIDASIYEEDNSDSSLISTKAKNITIFEPQYFCEMPKIVESIRNRNVTVLNMTKMTSKEAQRSIDFLAGGILAFDMEIEVLEDKYYLIAPNPRQIADYKTYISKGSSHSERAKKEFPFGNSLNHQFPKAS